MIIGKPGNLGLGLIASIKMLNKHSLDEIQFLKERPISLKGCRKKRATIRISCTGGQQMGLSDHSLIGGDTNKLLNKLYRAKIILKYKEGLEEIVESLRDDVYY